MSGEDSAFLRNSITQYQNLLEAMREDQAILESKVKFLEDKVLRQKNRIRQLKGGAGGVV